MSEGAGVQILTTAQVALDLGLPIHGIIALTHMAADKLGGSIPSPGRGLLSVARQCNHLDPSSLLDHSLRRRRINLSQQHVQIHENLELSMLDNEIQAREAQGEVLGTKYRLESERRIGEMTQREKRSIVRNMGNFFWKGDSTVSPLAGALASFGLSVEDLSIASFHGTSTVLNDVNECNVVNLQLRHLEKKPGRPIYTVFQKSLTGHSLGAAGAWMLNGALQMLHSGLIPGNRNVDNVESKLAQCEHLFFLNRNIQLPDHLIKAISLTSFGFGQKGAQALLIHPRYLYAAISSKRYEEYHTVYTRRCQQANETFNGRMRQRTLVTRKLEPPYRKDETATLLDPCARYG